MSLNQNNVNDEWSNFISTKNNDVSSDDEDEEEEEKYNESENENEYENDIQCPKAGDIYISTKSKIAYLTEPVDLNIFWDLIVMPYSTAKNGIIKKQIKFNSKTREELNFILYEE